MKPRTPDSGQIRALLRRGDPAQGESLAPEDVAKLRRRLTAEMERSQAPFLGSRTLALAALVVVLVTAALLRLSTAPQPPAPAKLPSPVQAVPAANVEGRQVHFVTPGGTRIVWVLSPNLNL